MLNFKYIIFVILCLIHILIWIFILFAFLKKKLAYYNVYYVIPIIYILHMFSFHFLNKIKKYMYNDWMKKVHIIENYILPIRLFQYCRNVIFKNSFGNPLSPQGMLILGLITSSYSLKY